MFIRFRHALPAFGLCLSLTTLANPQKPDGPPPRIDFAGALQIDAKTAQAVDQILREQHEKRKALGLDHETIKAKLDALRQETDEKLSKVLTLEQRTKLHQVQPKPPRPDDRPPGKD